MSIEDKTINTEKLIRLIETNNIIIYGAGYVAKNFIKALKKNDLYHKIRYITTTKLRENFFDDIQCANLDEIGNLDSFLICIAVHESVKGEIIERLKEKKISNYIWIYPNLYELLLGRPVKKDIRVPIKNIWLANREKYKIAIIYLAIDNYYGKNDYGYKIYKMTFSLFNNPETSENRLNQFIKLIESWEKNGYDKSKPALILENYNLVDGAHRTSLASYFNQEYIICNMYCADGVKESIHDRKVDLEKTLVHELNIDKRLVEILEETNKRIDEQYDL